jgi:thiamine biosynthesis protein ThiS
LGLEQYITLTINGEARDFSSIATLSDLVAHLGMKPDRVAIELNRELIRRESWSTVQLKDGDKLEIVHFVGGGAGEPDR